MKNILKSSILAFTLVIAFFVFVNTSGVMASGNKMVQKTTTSLPDSISKFVQRACMDCHSDDGNGMARGKVNFSKWETYSLQKQSDKAKAIFKILSKESMPPKGWKKNNPDRIPTKAEVEMVGKWANTLSQ